MTQRREVEARLALFDDLSGILGAMRSFALTELHRINKRETAQQAVMQSLTTALADLAAARPSQPLASVHADIGNTDHDIWLLFGSVRGFCGSFNEDVIRSWQTHCSNTASPLILVGERLHEMIADRENLLRLAGADSGLSASTTIDRILAAIADLSNHKHSFRLLACLRDEQDSHIEQLWPILRINGKQPGYPPMTYEPLADVATGVSQHYLYHSLLALLLRAIRAENHMRLMQMETALRHLERGSEEMQRQRNRLRQEEIVEEIELMIGSRH